VIPPGNEPSQGKLLDLEMLICLTGRERTEAEYARLLDAAGFRLTKVVPTAGEDSAIEARPAY
jgi:O-methyltransferase domain